MDEAIFEGIKDRDKFIVIDGNHLIHRAFYAIQNPLMTSKGEQTNAIYGFASMLLNIIELDDPTHIAMTFDEKAPTFRHEMHEEYKGTRKETPSELKDQIPRVWELIERFKMPKFSQPGFEADDFMGTLAVKARKEGMVTFIVTGDMDALQLINPDTYVVFPHKGYREPVFYDREAVIKKYGITPEQVVDLKALMGDTSDNIKGVDGIGVVGATKLINEYKTLDGIYEHLDEITGGIHDKLANGKEDAYFSQKLARIVTDVPFEFKKDDVKISRLDFAGLEKFFDEMEMRSLQRRIKKMMPDSQLLGKNQMSLF